MTEYTAEIIKIEFGHLLSAMSAWMPALEGISKSNLEANAATNQVAQSISEWNLPGQFELLNAQLSEAFAIQQETMQAFLEWDMLTQMETLNTNIIDNFTLQNESITALAEGMKEYFTEAFAAKDELFQLTMETLTAMLTESFAGSNELMSILMEGLTAYLVESNAIRNELSQTLMNSLLETLNMLSGMQQNLMMTMFSTLIVQLMTCFTAQWALLTSMITLLLTQITMNFTMLSIISASILSGITMITASIAIAAGMIVEACGIIAVEILSLQVLLGLLSSAVDSFKNKFVNEALPAITDTDNEKKSIKLAEEANDLARIGNNLAGIANDIALLSIGVSLITSLIPGFAEGGIPGYGELFIAREAGPEFVGSFGSRNVVMNNNQIVEAVSGGVYDAVRRANAEQSQQPIYLNVEAKVRENVLFDMMETVRAERGVRLSTGIKESKWNVPFHLESEMPKGGVRQSRTVALATSGQKYSSISLFTYHINFWMKGGDKKRVAYGCNLDWLNYGSLEQAFFYSAHKFCEVFDKVPLIIRVS